MSKETMGSGAAMGNQHTDAKRAFGWLWHSWLEAQREIPLLRWLSLAAIGLGLLFVMLAGFQGESVLEMIVYGLTALMFGLMVPIIFYLLFEVYRKHRSDAIFDSRRLADTIRKIAQEEIEAAYDMRK
jgi:hypothetical protein